MAAVLSWGTSESGALGQGERVGESLLPSQVLAVGSELEGREIVGVAAGDEHSIATDVQGNVYAWGRIREGQLGLGMKSSNPVCKPTRVEALRAHRITKACGGSGHSLFLTKTGTLYATGEHHERDRGGSAMFFGARGRQLSAQKRRMIEKSFLHYYSNGAKGTEYLLASPSESESSSGDDGAALEEGRSESLQINMFKRVIRSSPWEVQVQSQVGSKLRVVDISAGHCFSAAVTECGGLFTWGYNDKGQLGLGDRIAREEPIKVSKVGSQGSPCPLFRRVCCGEQHTVCLDDDGQAWAFGLGIFGQLGLGDGKDHFTPFKVEALQAVAPIAQVACGMYHTVFLSGAGQVFICGHKEYGQQGEASNFAESVSGRSQSNLLPCLLKTREMFAGVNLQPESNVPGPEGVAMDAVLEDSEGGTDALMSHIACGSLHSVAVTRGGHVLTWGWGGTGALGHGWGEGLGRRFAAAPVRSVEALAQNNTVQVCAGRRHTIALIGHSQIRHSLLNGGMRSLLEGGDFIDVCLEARCGGTVFASRCLLAARCARLASIIALSTDRFRAPPSRERDAARDVVTSGSGIDRNRDWPEEGGSQASSLRSCGRTEGRKVLHVPLPNVSLDALRLLVAFLHQDDCDVPAPLLDELSSIAHNLHLPRLYYLAKNASLGPSSSSSPSCFVNDMLNLLDTGLWSDVLLEPSSGGSRRPDLPPLLAHKAILSSRCEYFRVVLGSDFFVEGRDGRFSIDVGSGFGDCREYAREEGRDRDDTDNENEKEDEQDEKDEKKKGEKEKGGVEEEVIDDEVEDQELKILLSFDGASAADAPKARWRAFCMAIEWVYSSTLRLSSDDGLSVIVCCLGEADRLGLAGMTEAVEEYVEDRYADKGAFTDSRQLGILTDAATRHCAFRALQHLKSIATLPNAEE